MPLVIVTIFFIVLFSCEGFWHISCICREEKALDRFKRVEYDRRRRTDRYLDTFC